MDALSHAQPVARHPVVFGIYRDGDNNLDEAQERSVSDLTRTTAENRQLKVVVEDTTATPRPPFKGELRTESSIIEGGQQRILRVQAPLDMSDRKTLTDFVVRSLEAKASDARFADADVWLELVDHGAGDGGGLQADTTGGFMSIRDIAGAVTDGRAQFRAAHPGADDSVTGVVANQCLMASLGFADSLSRAGVRYLAASPETMIAPGAPSAEVADALTRAADEWPAAVVDATMKKRYGGGPQAYHPAAAFDVLDLDAKKVGAVRRAVTGFNDAVTSLADDPEAMAEIRSDLRRVRGMVRFDHTDMPWHADRPAVAAYDAIASDDRLPQRLRTSAHNVEQAVEALIVAHGESPYYAPFRASYADAAGPTAHLPVTRRSFDSWADAGVSETHNDFYDAVRGREFARAIGSYNAREDRAGALVA